MPHQNCRDTLEMTGEEDLRRSVVFSGLAPLSLSLSLKSLIFRRRAVFERLTQLSSPVEKIKLSKASRNRHHQVEIALVMVTLKIRPTGSSLSLHPLGISRSFCG
ncbi:hypothetical protein MRB53_016485 [Persea americana]|uniref:Uncharacterized protein n=1 Tax=Persea americana TaxID=3435 RepID=A0ACC2M1X8_PERAE|nr:hypothetical protein MRB53_016485 [Persea americana]